MNVCVKIASRIKAVASLEGSCKRSIRLQTLPFICVGSVWKVLHTLNGVAQECKLLLPPYEKVSRHNDKAERMDRHVEGWSSWHQSRWREETRLKDTAYFVMCVAGMWRQLWALLRVQCSVVPVGNCCITWVFAVQRWPRQFNLLPPTASQWVGIRCLLSFIWESYYTMSIVEMAEPHTEWRTPWPWAGKGFFTPCIFLWITLFLSQEPRADGLNSTCDDEPSTYRVPLKVWIRPIRNINLCGI